MFHKNNILNRLKNYTKNIKKGLYNICSLNCKGKNENKNNNIIIYKKNCFPKITQNIYVKRFV